MSIAGYHTLCGTPLTQEDIDGGYCPDCDTDLLDSQIVPDDPAHNDNNDLSPFTHRTLDNPHG